MRDLVSRYAEELAVALSRKDIDTLETLLGGYGLSGISMEEFLEAVKRKVRMGAESARWPNAGGVETRQPGWALADLYEGDGPGVDRFFSPDLRQMDTRRWMELDSLPVEEDIEGVLCPGLPEEFSLSGRF